MRAFLLAVAAVLIISGLIIAGVVTWRVWVDNRTATVNVALDTPAAGAGTAGAAIETGGMALQAAPAESTGATGATGSARRDPVVVIVPQAVLPAAQPQEAAPAEAPPEQPVTPTEEGCISVTVPGLPLDTSVYARGTVRLYNEPDIDAPTQGEFNAGAVFRIETTGEDGGTAIERCGLKWYRVRVSGASTIAVTGWVLADAVDIAPPEPPVTVTPGCTPQPQPCPGGCPQPPCQPNCWEPCQNPCCQSNPNPCECWDYPRG